MRSTAIARAQAGGDVAAVGELQRLSAADLVSDETKFVGLLVKWTEPFIPSDQRYLATPSAFPSEFCGSKLDPTLATLDARSAGYQFPVPFFVIQGRDDNRTPSAAAHAFLNSIRAPAKGYTAIEGGHFSCLTNPAGFLDALDRDMRSIRVLG